MVDSEVDYILKMVALGDGAVGKTSCIMRFTENRFGEKYKATIGTSIAVKNIQVEFRKGEVSKTQIVLWDLAGQPSYKDLRSRYMHGSSMGFIVYDVTRPSTFMNTYEWYRNFQAVCPTAVTVLVANKVDREDRLVPEEAGVMLSNWLGLKYIETSAKTGKNVNEMFIECSREAILKDYT
ncbi:GTP-binding protein [Candidatus Thorarchaeota archaeon]|nr:MAG: GTP-binding protein [Candidatus Thorarchaeota archaeon]